MATTFKHDYIDLLKYYYYVGGMPEVFLCFVEIGDFSKVQLKTLSGVEAYYWTNERNTSELDFLLDVGNAVVPLEVKAEINLQSKSLKAFVDKFNPAVSVRSSMADYKQEGWLINLPLYAISNVLSCIREI